MPEERCSNGFLTPPYKSLWDASVKEMKIFMRLKIWDRGKGEWDGMGWVVKILRDIYLQKLGELLQGWDFPNDEIG